MYQDFSDLARIYPAKLPDDPGLGVNHSKDRTVVRLYAPQADAVNLLLYDAPGELTQEDYLAVPGATFAEKFRALPDFSHLSEVPQDPVESLPMTKDEAGIFEIELAGNHFARRYKFELRFGEEIVLSIDPYAKIVTANGEASVIGQAETLTLIPSERSAPFVQQLEAIIYEAHVRDFSIRPNGRFKHPGTFLGLAETGLKDPAGRPYGLDYVAELGVTHLQLLPIYQFQTVDEKGDLSFNAQYNWGYDPRNYFAVSGVYSTAPLDPFKRILELKEMVRTVNGKGLRVIMDVVFNHVYDFYGNPLQLTNPNAFFRMAEDGTPHNGSHCGNEVRSEHPYMRRFIVDCLLYWCNTFHISGFRFDLMGLMDVDTLNLAADALQTVDPGMVLIGEGWNMGNHPHGVQPANSDNAKLMPDYGFFNDDLRDACRGGNFAPDYNHGFLLSNSPEDISWKVFNNLLGGQFRRDFGATQQNVLYLECHDNHTLWDKLKIECPDDSDADIRKRHMLGLFLITLGHGVLFYHMGMEFFRTKDGIDNSYNIRDEINSIDWSQKAAHEGDIAHLKELIRFRKAHNNFKHNNPYSLRSKAKLLIAEQHKLAYSLTDHQKKYLYVANANDDRSWVLNIPGPFQVLAKSLPEMDIPQADGSLEVPPLTGVLIECHCKF